jgi:hypothetical protein
LPFIVIAIIKLRHPSLNFCSIFNSYSCIILSHLKRRKRPLISISLCSGIWSPRHSLHTLQGSRKQIPVQDTRDHDRRTPFAFAPHFLLNRPTLTLQTLLSLHIQLLSRSFALRHPHR